MNDQRHHGAGLRGPVGPSRLEGRVARRGGDLAVGAVRIANLPHLGLVEL